MNLRDHADDLRRIWVQQRIEPADVPLCCAAVKQCLDAMQARDRARDGIDRARRMERKARKLAERGLKLPEIAKTLGCDTRYAFKLVRPGGLWGRGPQRRGTTKVDLDRLRTMLDEGRLTPAQMAEALGCGRSTVIRLRDWIRQEAP